MLRVPLESGKVTLSRAGRSTVYPALFQLLVAANPCPCGNFGSKNRICLCSARSVELYWKKFSEPLLDRIDMRIRVDSSISQGSTDGIRGIPTLKLRPAIAAAVAVQRRRQGKRNARLAVQEVAEFCRPEPAAKKVLDAAARRHGFSPRAVASCLKLARTIADMEEAAAITVRHMEEAVEYRKTGVGLDVSPE